MTTTLNIVNYNVKMISTIVFDDKQFERAALIPAAIRQAFPATEIVAMEELFDDDAEQIMDTHMSSIGLPHRSQKVGSNFIERSLHGRIDDGGIKIYSKYPILSQEQTIFRQGSTEDGIAAKGAVRITIVKEGQKINIIATHTQSGKNEPQFSQKISQFRQIRTDLLDNLPEDEPILIAGDFNLDPIGQGAAFTNVLGILKSKRLEGPLVGSTSTDFNNGTVDTENRLLDHVIFVENQVPVSGVYQIGRLRREEGYRLKTDMRKNIPGAIANLVTGGLVGTIQEAAGEVETGFDRLGCELNRLNPFTPHRDCAQEARDAANVGTHIAHDLSDHQPIFASIIIGEIPVIEEPPEEPIVEPPIEVPVVEPVEPEKEVVTDNVIKYLNNSIFTEQDKLLADLVNIAYKAPSKRPIVFKFINNRLKYNSERSTDLYALYEDTANIIFAIHGATTVEENIAAISVLRGQEEGERLFRQVCDVYQQLLDNDKEVIVASHSLGSFSANLCGERLGKHLRHVSFGAYLPNVRPSFARNLSRKHVYSNDFLANKVLKSSPINTLEYKRQLQSRQFLNGHTITNFLDKRRLNKDLAKRHNIFGNILI